MGAVYTNTDNAIRCTNNIEGPIGKTGYTGLLGPTGNTAVWSESAPTEREIISLSQRGLLNPVDKDGNTLPTDSNGTWPKAGDYWVHSINGDVYQCQTDGAVSSFTYLNNRIGDKGSDNFLKTEVSFNGEKTALGYSVTTIDKKTLVGHFIYPGKRITGDINNVRVLINSNTEGNNINAAIYLVNLGEKLDTTDDIVVASASKKLISGSGNDASWQIIDLDVTNANLPPSQAVFGVFVLLRATREKEIAHTKELTTAYNEEIAAAYAERLRDTDRVEAGAFYETLEESDIYTEAESPIRRQQRIAERSSYLVKRDLAEKDAAVRLEESLAKEKIPYSLTNNIEAEKEIWTYTPVSFKIDIKVAHITIS